MSMTKRAFEEFQEKELAGEEREAKSAGVRGVIGY